MLITIITSTYNSAQTLPLLINTFRRAKVRDVEWVIIDGASTDDTVKLISEASDIIDMFISEPDNGIYDAWNKGLKIAHGEYIGFIGSDDYLSERFFHEAISAIQDKSYNIIGFQIRLTGNGNEIISLHNKNYKKPFNYPFNLGFYHVGTLHRSDLFKDSSFDTSYKISGDREFLNRKAHLLRPKIHLTQEPLIFFSMEGISSNASNRSRTLKEDYRVFNYIIKNSPFSIYSYFFYFMKISIIGYLLLKTKVKYILKRPVL